MPRSVAVAVYVALALMVLFVANNVIYYVSPIFAWLHPIAKGLSGFVACLSIPILAYQLAAKKMDGTVQVAIWSSVGWLALALTSPSVDRDERWAVQGLVGDKHDENRITREIICYCYEDAKAAARTLYKDHRDWPKHYSDSVDGVKPSDLPETDVRIDYFSTTPALDGVNRLLGTHYGTDFYTTSLRFIENGEDPFMLIDDLYRPKPDYDRFDFYP